MFIIILFLSKKICMTFLIIICLVVTESKKISCKRPKTPSFVEITTNEKEEYEADEKIAFTCNEGYVLMAGASENTCNTNGNWTEELPSCLRNLAFQREINCIGIDIVNETKNESSDLQKMSHQKSASLVVDGNKETCVQIITNRESKMRIYLDNEYNISFLEITGKIEKIKGKFEGTVKILKNESNPDNHERKSFFLKDKLDDTPVEFENVLGSIVEVLLPAHRTLSLCDVQIFSKYGSSTECNEPTDIPNCKVQMFWYNGTQLAEYKYTNGSSVRNGALKCIEGYWEDKEIICASASKEPNPFVPIGIAFAVFIPMIIFIILVVVVVKKKRKRQSSLYSSVKKEPYSNGTADPIYEMKNEHYGECDPKSRNSRNSNKDSDGPIYSEIPRRPDSELI